MSLCRLLLFVLFRHLKCLQYGVKLDPDHLTHDAVTITEHPTIYPMLINNSAVWRLSPQSQKDYDLLIQLHNEWTFNPFIQSELSLILNGNTPHNTLIDGEFIIVFSIHPNQYFSVAIRLDTARNLWKIYPGIDSNITTFATTNDVYTDIISGIEPGNTHNRWCRASNNHVCSSSHDTWSNIRPFHKDALEWPLTVKLINDPITDTLMYQCFITKDGILQKTLQMTYSKAFNTHKMIEIYIMNDADGGRGVFDISDIHIQYKDNATNMSVINFTSTESVSETSTTHILTETTVNNRTVGSNVSNETVFPTVAPTNAPTVSGPIPEWDQSIGTDKDKIGMMIGIAIGCVCFAICIVLGIYFFFKKKQEENDTNSNLNRSEYHTPTEVSAANISEVLEKKRKDSRQWAMNNKRKKRTMSGNSTNGSHYSKERTQSIIPVSDSNSEQSDGQYIDSDENQDDTQFNED